MAGRVRTLVLCIFVKSPNLLGRRSSEHLHSAEEIDPTMNSICLGLACLLSLLYLASSSPLLDETHKNIGSSPVGDLGPLSDPSESGDADPDKRGWNNLSNMWGKRGWNNLQGMWGKRDWNKLSNMWGKRDWNKLSNMWGKRDWNNLQGMWGKRDWNDLSGMWGKRNNWNNLQGMWGKRTTWDRDDGSKRTSQWNNLKGVWGKRGDPEWALLERVAPGDDEIQGLVIPAQM